MIILIFITLILVNLPSNHPNNNTIGILQNIKLYLNAPIISKLKNEIYAEVKPQPIQCILNIFNIKHPTLQ